MDSGSDGGMCFTICKGFESRVTGVSLVPFTAFENEFMTTDRPNKVSVVENKSSKPLSKDRRLNEKTKGAYAPQKQVVPSKRAFKPSEGNPVKPREAATSQEPDKKLTPAEKKAKQKELLEQRKANDPHWPVVKEVKPLHIKLSDRKTPNRERKQLVHEIVDKLSDHIGDICLRQEAGRILQTCVELGWAEDRDKIAEKVRYLDLATDKYGKHLLNSLLLHSLKARSLCAEAFKNHVSKLVTNRIASPIIDSLFVRFLDDKQRAKMLSEFYGNDYALFGGDFTLEEYIKKQPAKRPLIAARLRDVLETVFRKESLAHVIVHRLMVQYAELEEPAKLQDWNTGLYEVFSVFATSADGSRLASQILATATTKDRKIIVKEIKDSLFSLARHEHAHKLVLACFHLVDDTKLTGKLASDLCEDLEAVIRNTHSRRVLLFLLGGKSPYYIPAETISILEHCESINTGKKDQQLRVKELQQVIKEPVIEFVSTNWDSLMRNSYLSGVILEAFFADPRALSELVLEKTQECSAQMANLIKKILKRCDSDFALSLLDNIDLTAYSEFAEGKEMLVTLAIHCKDAHSLQKFSSKLPSETLQQILTKQQ